MLTKREALKAMGIEVWRERSNLPEAALMPDAHAEPPVSSAGGSHSALDALKATVSHQADDAASLPPAKPRNEPVSPASSGGDQDVPNFRYGLLHYGSIGLCVSLSAGQSNTENAVQASGLPRRLCDDIAKLLGGDTKAVRFQELAWPMVQSSGIDQSLSVARQVVTDKFRQLPAKVVVIGQDVGRCFQLVDDLASYTPGSFGSQQFLVVPSLDELMSSGEHKKTLMMALLAWR